jgi:hypothetical protein
MITICNLILTIDDSFEVVQIILLKRWIMKEIFNLMNFL